MARQWSEGELATLAEVAETFVRGGALHRAELAAEALGEVADPSQLLQLRLVLRAFENRAASLLLGAGPRAFRDLSPARRERYLLDWGCSRVPQRRSAYQVLARLLTFLAYAAAEGEPNARLEAIGYRPDRPPTTDDRTGIVPLAPPAGGEWQLEADVVIAGSGAGGSLIAHDLAAAGRSVVVVEAGSFVDEGSMPRHERDAFENLYLDHGLSATWDASVTLLAGSAVGGGTLINWMTCIDSPPDIRGQWAVDHGIDGWDAAAAERDAAAIAVELGAAQSEVIPKKDAMILRGAAELGWEVAKTSRNATGCGDCGSCGFGCPRGTKQSGLRAHLARAHAAGARIIGGARVERVLVEGGRAVGIVATIAADGAAARRLTVRAPQVVVAAGGLRTPGILARSEIQHPAIGRHLRVHPVPLVAGLFDEPIEMWNGTLQAARTVQFLWPEPGRKPYVIESAPGHPGLLAFALPWEGTDQHQALMDRARFIAPLIAVTEDGGEGRVSMTRSGRTRVDYRLDAIGVATLRHALVSMARLARAAGARQIVAVGTPPRWFGRSGSSAGTADRAFVVYEDALRAFDFAPNRGGVFSAHQMGTARMGADPADHVCDPGGRVRLGSRGDAVLGGLYVADSSLFPTGIGVNPMLTVMAMARRVGRTVLAEG